MPKVLLIGPAGCGKTHLLLDSFEKALRNASDPLASDMFFIVPSMEHTERLVSLLMQRGISGFFHKRVTTLSQLITNIFRIQDIPVASSLTRVMIVKDLLRINAWEYFSGVQDQPGFIGLMNQFLTELKEACLSPDIFRERMNALKGLESAYASKYEALAAFYEQYEEELKKRGLRDSQDALRIFRERKQKGEMELPRIRALGLDGFFDFSNLQLEYLRELSEITETITITLTQDTSAGREELFEAVGRTRADLEKLGFKIQEMKPHSFRTKNPSLLFLQKNLFRGNDVPPSNAPLENMVFLDAVGIEGEIELIAREIHRLSRSSNYRYSDFAVLFRQIRNYGQVLGSIFERYGIPVEIHERDRLKFSSWIAATVSFLSVFKNGWQAEDLFGFLKSNHVRMLNGKSAKDDAWLSIFEQRSLHESTLTSREAWLGNWKGRANEDLTMFNQEKAGILQPLLMLEENFRAAQTAEEHIRIFQKAIYETFGILEIQEAYTPFVRRDAAACQRFESLLEEIRRYFSKNPDAPVSFESFSDYFLGLVELDVYSLHERDKNRVQIYDISLARQKEYKVVFVAGLLEKGFPMQVREDPLLSDWERKLMNGGLQFPLAEQLPRQGIERLFFYLAVTRASERLYLSYPHMDLEGKESLPSFYLEEVRGLFQNKIPVIRQNLARPYPMPEEAITLREQEVAALGTIREVCEKGQISGQQPALDFAGEVLQNPESRERLLTALKSIEAELLDQRIRHGRYFEVEEVSPTRLEVYGKCPYRYFAERILQLQDPTENINIMQKGNILHQVLQLYFSSKRNKKEPLETFLRRELEAGLEKYPLVWPEKHQEELDRRDLYETLFYFLTEENKRLEISSFHPAYVEYSFGSSPGFDAPALEIGEGKEKVRLRGRIDRIDVDPAKKCAVVLDYKSGKSTNFKRSALELGTALQLPLYLLAVERNLGLKPLGGEIYSIRGRRRSGFYCADLAAAFGKEFSVRSQIPAEDFRKILDRAVDFAEAFMTRMLSLEISVKPRDCESFCPYDTVCRIEKWKLPMILQQIKDEEKIRDSHLGTRDSF